MTHAHVRLSPVGRRSHRGDHPAAPAACAGHGHSDRAPGRSHRRGRRTGGARDHRHRSSPHLEGGRGARFGGDAAADWYPAALRQLASLGIPTKLVSLLPAPTTLGIDETVAAIAKAVGTTRKRSPKPFSLDTASAARRCWPISAGTGRIEPSPAWSQWPAGSRWWVNMDLNFASITSAAGPITVHLSDNDPFAADWRANAADWLGKLGAEVHIAHGAGHYMTTSPGPVLDTIHVASHRTTAR